MTLSPSKIQNRPPAEEIARLQRAKYSLIPLGGGDDGKSPLGKLVGRPRRKLGQILAPMHNRRSLMYGIRLDGLVVVDLDSDDPKLLQEMERRFGVSPVHVKTPRGRHLYYSAGPGKLPNLKKEGFPVDIKRGANSYVAGPGSIRTDGGDYLSVKDDLATATLPMIKLPPAGKRRVEEGNRHNHLVNEAKAMVEFVDSQSELAEKLFYLRDETHENPESMTEGEVEGIAAWAWKLRLEGQLYSKLNSAFRISRQHDNLIFTRLSAPEDAFALYSRLVKAHGHCPGKTFVLDYAAMRENGLVSMSLRRFIAARDGLISLGLLSVAKNHRAGRCKRRYQLSRPMPTLPNVEKLPRRKS